MTTATVGLVHCTNIFVEKNSSICQSFCSPHTAPAPLIKVYRPGLTIKNSPAGVCPVSRSTRESGGQLSRLLGAVNHNHVTWFNHVKLQILCLLFRIWQAAKMLIKGLLLLWRHQQLSSVTLPLSVETMHSKYLIESYFLSSFNKNKHSLWFPSTIIFTRGIYQLNPDKRPVHILRGWSYWGVFCCRPDLSSESATRTPAGDSPVRL